MLVAFCLGAAAPAALASDRLETVHFRHGAESATLGGTIGGHDGVSSYRLTVELRAHRAALGPSNQRIGSNPTNKGDVPWTTHRSLH